MSCKHPLKAFNIGVNPSTGNNLLKVTSYKVDHLEKLEDGKIKAFYDSDIHNVFGKVYRNYEEIPCGQCISCRLDYSRQWANRCALEMKYHKTNYFVTLTYDNDHLPCHTVLDYVDSDGCITNVTVSTLRKRDFQLFMKNLRSHFNDQKIRFFACGEYGSQTARSHYHAILFGLELNDLKVYKTIKQGNKFVTYYTSKTISDIWKKGYVIIAPATWESVAYTARYVTKKLNGSDADIYKKLMIEPEFCLMSRKPGIGKQYFDDNYKHIFETNRIYISNLNGSRCVVPPRYYKKALENLDEDLYNKIKSHNKEQAEISKMIKLSKTSLSYLDYLEVEENELKEKIKSLKRDKV